MIGDTMQMAALVLHGINEAARKPGLYIVGDCCVPDVDLVVTVVVQPITYLPVLLLLL